MAINLERRPAVRKPGENGDTLLCRECGIEFGAFTYDIPSRRKVGGVCLEPVYEEKGDRYFAETTSRSRKPPTVPASEALLMHLVNYIVGGKPRGCNPVHPAFLPISVECRHCGCENEVNPK